MVLRHAQSDRDKASHPDFELSDTILLENVEQYYRHIKRLDCHKMNSKAKEFLSALPKQRKKRRYREQSSKPLLFPNKNKRKQYEPMQAPLEFRFIKKLKSELSGDATNENPIQVKTESADIQIKIKAETEPADIDVKMEKESDAYSVSSDANAEDYDEKNEVHQDMANIKIEAEPLVSGCNFKPSGDTNVDDSTLEGSNKVKFEPDIKVKMEIESDVSDAKLPYGPSGDENADDYEELVKIEPDVSSRK